MGCSGSPPSSRVAQSTFQIAPTTKMTPKARTAQARGGLRLRRSLGCASLPGTHTLTLSVSVTHTQPLSICLCHTHTLSIYLSLSHTHSLSLCHAHTHTLCLCHTCSLSVYTLSLCLCLSRSVSLSLSFACTHTHSVSVSVYRMSEEPISPKPWNRVRRGRLEWHGSLNPKPSTLNLKP